MNLNEFHLRYLSVRLYILNVSQFSITYIALISLKVCNFELKMVGYVRRITKDVPLRKCVVYKANIDALLLADDSWRRVCSAAWWVV